MISVKPYEQNRLNMFFSIITPVTRPELVKETAKALAAQSFKDFEVFYVSDIKVNQENTETIIENDLNPALRRNIASLRANGEYLVFLDDDAVPHEKWLERAFQIIQENKNIDALGGPDLLRSTAEFPERLTNVLLSHKVMGSGVKAHQEDPQEGIVKDPSSLALCNLFIKKEVFIKLGGLNEGIGYGGEDTELMHRVLKNHTAFFSPDLYVFHKKRDFGLPYFKQRFKFRFNNGKLLLAFPSMYLSNKKFLAFVIVGLVFLALLLTKPLIAANIFAIYLIIGTIFTIPYLNKDKRYIILPICFALQHTTYYVGLLLGVLSAFNWKKIINIRKHNSCLKSAV